MKDSTEAERGGSSRLRRRRVAHGDVGIHGTPHEREGGERAPQSEENEGFQVALGAAM